VGAWLAANGYCGRIPTGVLLDRLEAGPDGLRGDAAAAATHPRHRILARAWLRVIWRCWQDGVDCNPPRPRQPTLPHPNRRRQQAVA
jgi:hypothetical protein